MEDRTNIVWSTAREYARAGIYVNPIHVNRKPDGKKDVRPIGLWRNTSSASLADIAVWEHEHPGAGLLIDCGKSRLVVVDCDRTEGVSNWKALKPPPPIGIVHTAGGGEHWYYGAHPDHVIGNDQSGKIAPHVDIRGLGGFVIAPPTSDGSGSWTWQSQPLWTARDVRVAPEVVIERMRATRVVREVAPRAAGEDPFDEPARVYTREQARAFIKREIEKLGQTRSGFNGAINNFAMACAHFPWLIDRERCARLMIRALGPATGWAEPDYADRRTIDSAYSATEAGRSWVAIEHTETAAEPAEAEAEGPLQVLPPPGQPLQVARELITQIPATRGELHWSWWRDEFYRWTGAHWEVFEEPEVHRWLYQQTGDAVFLAPPKKEGEDFIRTPWAPTRRKIGDLAHALGLGTLQRTGDEDRVLAAANGVVERSAGGRTLAEHRPSRFNLFSLPFDYDPSATAPAWQAFLDQVLPGDRQAQEFLAEWFGYVLSGRTEQQKMAALIGKKRSGKGTIARVLSALVGRENVSGLNLGTLSGTFGLEPFIGAALAVASDVRWHSRSIGDAVQILLEVSGEDHVTVNRKNKPAWKGRLGVRFMIMSNDTPTFSDRSGALVDRMIYVAFRESFFGREDTGLTDKLMGELPGILNWALDGLDRLDGRGRFTQPESGLPEAENTRRLADPIGAFIEDWCELGPEQSISLDHLYLKYRAWCEGEGRVRDTTTKEILSRELRQKVDGLKSKRTREGGKFVTVLRGIGSSAM
jgi:putative DNA primase/helicase